MSELCHDLPLIDARVFNSTPDPDGEYSAVPNQNGIFSGSQIDHDLGKHADPGEILQIRIYFDNTADDLGDAALETRGIISFSPTPSQTHVIEGFLISDNSNLASSRNRGGDITVYTNVPTTLQYIADSASLCLQEGDAMDRGVDITISDPNMQCGVDGHHRPKYVVNTSPDPSSGDGAEIGDIKPGFLFSGFLNASYRVVASTNK